MRRAKSPATAFGRHRTYRCHISALEACRKVRSYWAGEASVQEPCPYSIQYFRTGRGISRPCRWDNTRRLQKVPAPHFFPVRWIPDRDINPGCLVKKGSFKRESLETIFSMVPAHSAFPNPTEWKISVNKVNNGFVDSSGSGLGAHNYFPLYPFWPGKNIQGKWSWFTANNFQGVIQIAVFYQR